MDLADSMSVSVSALDAQRQRLNVIASNLANANSTRSSGGGPYKRRDVVFHSAPLKPGFAQAFRRVSNQAEAGTLKGVRVAQVIEDVRPGRPLYDPKHPDADPNGYVVMPNVNVMEEMVNMIAASRAYEANVQAVNATRTMWNRALEIGR
jgi:flagellar basal-body rod protein FlgC